MINKKILASILLGTALLVMQVSTVMAAPAREDPTPTPTPTTAPAISGTIQSITLQTDSAGTTTVVVTLTDSTGATQTVNLSLETATSLGLVSNDASGAPVVNSSMVGQSITLDPSVILPPAQQEPENPVAAALAAFFGLDYQTVEGYHEDGTGYGVIAQSCFLSYALGGDASQCGAIIEAKKSGDYSAFILPDGTTASNWGQFRKAILDKHNPLETLGAIMSKHAKPDQTGTSGDDQSTTSSGSDSGNGNGQGNGNGHGGGGGNGHGHGHGKP